MVGWTRELLELLEERQRPAVAAKRVSPRAAGNTPARGHRRSWEPERQLWADPQTTNTAADTVSTYPPNA